MKHNYNLVFAAVFAAIPLLPPWIVSVFGIVELYFVREDALLTAIFGVANLAPLFFADPAFYRELK